MDEKKFKELLLQNNQNLIKEIDKKFEEVDNKFKEAEERRINDNFYLEHTYGEKISIIFDKIQLIDDLKVLNDKENQSYKNKVERNSAILMSHDFRISKLEKNLNSKKI